MSDEIRDAASETAKQGGDLRGKVHDLTLEALKSRRFDREAIRDVVRAVTEGITRGAEGSRLGVRQTLAEGFRGMDQALTASVSVFKLQATVSAPVRRAIVEAPAPRAVAPKAVARKPAPRKPEPAFADGDWQEF